MFRLFRHKTGIQLLKKSLSTYESCIENAAKETRLDFEKMTNSPGSGDFLAGAPASGIRMFTPEERARRIQQAREVDIPMIATLEDTHTPSKSRWSIKFFVDEIGAPPSNKMRLFPEKFLKNIP